MNRIHETSCPHITHILVKTNEDGRIDLVVFFLKMLHCNTYTKFYKIFTRVDQNYEFILVSLKEKNFFNSCRK